jgi:hypothetical protein
MTDPHGGLLDETVLRRALRLEADERAPAFDAAAIAAAARSRPRVAVISALVAIAISTVGAVTVWSLASLLLPPLAASVFSLGLEVLAIVAVPASAILDVVQQPVVPLSLLAAIVIATAHELRQRKELVHARAS